MKKVFGILLISCICIALGLLVRWSREQGVSLAVAVSSTNNNLICYE